MALGGCHGENSIHGSGDAGAWAEGSVRDAMGDVAGGTGTLDNGTGPRTGAGQRGTDDSADSGPTGDAKATSGAEDGAVGTDERSAGAGGMAHASTGSAGAIIGSTGSGGQAGGGGPALSGAGGAGPGLSGAGGARDGGTAGAGEKGGALGAGGAKGGSTGTGGQAGRGGTTLAGTGGASSQAGGAPGVGGIATTDAGSTVDYGKQTGPFRIIIDYRFDTQSAFTPDKRAAVRVAAELWEASITSNFDAVPAGTALRTINPEAPTGTAGLFTVDYAIDDVVVFMGFCDLDGPGVALAKTWKAFSNEVQDAALLAKLNDRYYGSVFQPWLGSIGIDRTETFFVDPTPATDWDITTYDFITIVTHEIGHVLGIGNCNAFDSLVSGGQFLGSHAVAVYGGPVPLSSDGHHIANSVRSDGRAPTMVATDPDGRSRPTSLDFAILEDIGYSIAH